MAARAYTAISIEEPLMTITSGTDEASALTFWTYLQGQPLYADPHKFPYVATYYNWLYYVFYGAISGAAIKVFSLDIAWIPTVGRWVSLAWTVSGFLVAGLLFCKVKQLNTRMRFIYLPYAAYIFFGPLVGFWAISLNVELAATTCGIIATFVFVSLYNEKPVAATLLTCVFAYIAWSFKQSHIMVVGALGLFLLIRRDWRCLSFVCIIQGAGWGAALLAGSEAYVKMLLFKGTDKTLELARLYRNLTNFVSKTTPFLFLNLAIATFLWRNKKTSSAIFKDIHALFSLCGLFVSVVISVIFSAKQGAAENYYFLMTFFMVYAGLALMRFIPEHQTSAFGWNAILMVGWLASIGAILSILLGMNGIISTHSWHAKHEAQRECLRGLPGPFLPVGSPYVALPWMTTSEPRFDVAHNYSRDRLAGRWFEADGFGGLIRQAYFGTIILGQGAEPSYDGVVLKGIYRLEKSYCSGIDIYVRAADSGS